MPALLAKFRPVPPLVRAKASNLLDTIREAVNAHGEKAIEPQTSMEIDNGNTVEPTVAIDTTITTVASTAESSSSTASLWTKKTAGKCCQSYMGLLLTLTKEIFSLFHRRSWVTQQML